MTPASRRSSGFTLLEVVIAFTALALVTGICYAAFHLGMGAVTRGTAAVVTQQRLRMVMDVFMRQLKSAIPYGANYSQNGGLLPYFECDGEHVAYVTATGQLSGGRAAWVRYAIQNEALWLCETPMFDPTSVGTGSHSDEADRCMAELDKKGGSSGVCGDTMTCGRMLDGFVMDGQKPFSCEDPSKGWTTFKNLDDEDTNQTLPLAVAVRFAGLPGMDGVFEQWVPLVLPSYHEEGGALDEETEERFDSIEDLDDGEGNDAGPGQQGHGKAGHDAADDGGEE